ncbi:PREDICTED: protein POLLENLESS 3-LIKE 2 [Tarenaya hassleriana]|uniref:protein POLLENLESS 3-LIKE 2 n=1 Tax=Tarenaya hassleriana TaxID=28532 RepID=UPI00053C1923|nr:PREDICTED: protein POLLENLESS 3-LIKE 2 [Tarenaya hassleriana]
MMKDAWNAPPGFRPTKSAPSSPAKPLGVSRTRSESFGALHKVPVGDTPYVRAKNVQLVEKDPERAIPLFWAAINAGDRVDSALKDMAIVMKQQNRAEEAIEAIKSLRSRCSDQAQESLDNILLDLYKRCGRLDDQIALLKHKLFLIQQGLAFNGKRTKTARSQGKKFQVSVEQEATRLLGNLGWALMQKDNYVEAEDAYRRALSITPDNNKMCNLGICLMKQGRIGEAKETLRRVKPAVADGPRGVDSHLKAYERAQQMLKDLESEMMNRGGDDKVEQSKLFNAFFGSSSIWQPQPCRDHGAAPATANGVEENANPNVVAGGNSSGSCMHPPPLHRTVKQAAVFKASSSSLCQPQPKRSDDDDENVMGKLALGKPPPLHRTAKQFDTFFGSSSVWQSHPLAATINDGYPDENVDANMMGFPPLHRNMNLNVDAQPFFSSKFMRDHQPGKDPIHETLKRTRSGNAASDPMRTAAAVKHETNTRRRLSLERTAGGDSLLPDNKDFEEAILAAVLGTETKNSEALLAQRKVEKRLKVFQDITLSLSPRA